MKIKDLPESAFAVYSEKLKQKKKSKPIAQVQNGTGKVHKKKKAFTLTKELEKKFDEFNSVFKELESYEESTEKNIITSKNHKKKGVPNITNEINNGINSIQTQKKSKPGKKINKKFTDNVVGHKGDTGSSEGIMNNLSKSKIMVSVLKNNSPLQGKKKQNKKTKLMPDNQNLPTKLIKTKQNLSFEEVEKSLQIKKNSSKEEIKKNFVEEKSFQSKKINKRNQKLFHKLAVNEIGKTSMAYDWTNQENSIKTSKRLFEWLIMPIKEGNFMRDYWEKQPLLIQRVGSRKHYSELLSTPAIDAIFRDNCIFFTKHVDVTSYSDGVRETFNLSGRAQANVVWDFYSNGCSVRMLNPQAFVPKIHALNASLQEYFGCFVGANVYLTPPNSQGFAPHYDDIEAFVLQIEGKKRWKVYPPRSENEALPRLSSPNFCEEEVGEPLLEVTLEPGDMLYFPRGFIHQASTVEGEHSLHITLSAYQKTAWVDLLEKALPIALKRASTEDVEFRKGLPLNYLGLEHHGSDSKKTQFVNTAMSLMSRLGHFLSLSLGAGVDQMGAQFMHDALPPVFTPEEKAGSGLRGGLKMKENGSITDRLEFLMTTQVKLIRANICRLVEEESEVRLYHCLDNPLEYHAEEPQFLVLPEEGVAVITVLAQSYPAFVKVNDLPHTDEEALVTLVSDLWDAGLLLAKGMDHVPED